MFVECIDESGFEDQLTAGECYRVVAFSNGGNCIMVENDQGDRVWYGDVKFSEVKV